MNLRRLYHSGVASLFATFGRVIYRGKLVLTPCDYRMQQRSPLILGGLRGRCLGSLL